VNENRLRFAVAEKAQSQLHRPEIFRSIDQNDVARFDQLWKNLERVAETAVDILSTAQSLFRNRNIGRSGVRFQTNDLDSREEAGENERALGAGAT
jgi:hypothetical protein